MKLKRRNKLVEEIYDIIIDNSKKITNVNVLYNFNYKSIGKFVVNLCDNDFKKSEMEENKSLLEDFSIMIEDLIESSLYHNMTKNETCCDVLEEELWNSLFISIYNKCLD